jgi:hypothetical protein
MKPLLLLAFVLSSMSFAQKSTIDLTRFKNNKNYAVAEVPLKVGTHTFTLINIKPLVKSDTACISAIVIDKRKYVLFDIGVAEGAACGLFVCKQQPLKEGIIVLKASPSDGKTFIFLSNGKLVSLPGASCFVDTMGKNIYCVWENDTQYRLTVFDYKNMRIVIPTTLISRPMAWYNNGMSFCFTAPDEKGYSTVDMFSKSIVKGGEAEGTLAPVSYLMDFGKLDASKCCGAQALKR